MHPSISRGAMLLAALSCLAVPQVRAADAAVPTAAPPARSGFADAPRQDERRLARLRGGADPVWNDMKLNGAVGANTAQNVTTGDNIIRDNAFANAAGLPTVIQNSGANVLIQNATIVNVQIR